MPGVATTADLVLTPEFVDHFLTTWGRANYRGMISQLGYLGRVCLYAVERGYLAASAHDARPIPPPPGWDADGLRRRAAEKAGHTRPSRTPSRREVARLLDYLKAEARSWERSRLHALVATVAGAGLTLTEALALRVDDIDLTRRTIRVAVREQFGRPKFPPRVVIGDSLAEVLDAWLPRTHPEYVFPNRLRSGPWRPTSYLYSPGFSLKEACEAIGIEALEFHNLRCFWESDQIARALDPATARPPRRSPGRRPPGPKAGRGIPIARLRDEVLALYEPPRRSPSAWHGIRRVFAILEKAGVRRTCDLGPAIIGPFLKAWGGTNPKVSQVLLSKLRTVAGYAVRLGYLDVDPFADPSRPQSQTRAWRPAGAVDGRTRAGGGPAAPSRHPAAWKGRGPVVLGGAEDSPTWMSQPVPPLKAIPFCVIKSLCDAGPEGLSLAELRSRSGCPDARGVIRRLKAASPVVWRKAILPPDRSKGLGYRLGPTSAWSGTD